MISTITRDFVSVNGAVTFGWKEYPNWYGIEDIGFISRGCWSDPEIEYKGKLINATIVEDSMWESFREYCKEMGWDESEHLSDFVGYMKDNAEEVYEFIELALEGGC